MTKLRNMAVLAFQALTGIAFLGALSEQWSAGGAEREFIGLVLLCGPLHLRRLLAVRGGRPLGGVEILTACLESVALMGPYVARPVPAWSLEVSLLALLVMSGYTVEDQEGPVAPRALRYSGALTLLAACLTLGRSLGSGDTVAVVALIVTIAEALVPATSRTADAWLRRLAAASVIIVVRWSEVLADDRPILELVVGLVSLGALKLAYTEVSARRVFLRRLALRVLALMSPPLLIVIGGEVAFRIFPNRYQDIVLGDTGAFHMPLATHVYEGAPLGLRQPFRNEFRWSSRGWHDVEHSTKKPPGTTRVLVLGDSFVEGRQVPVDELYHQRLGSGLAEISSSSVEAIALGWSGWGQVNELAALETTGFHFAPDLVVVEFLGGNDVRNNDPVLETTANEESSRGTWARARYVINIRRGWLFQAYLCDKIDQVLRRARGQQEYLDAEVYRRKPRRLAARWAQAWDRTEELLITMKRAAEAHGVELVVAIFTSAGEIEACVPGTPAPGPDLDLRYPALRIVAFCERQGIRVVDLAPRLARLAVEQRRRLHLEGDGHWSIEGHRAAAAATVEFLTRETDAWSRALAHARLNVPK